MKRGTRKELLIHRIGILEETVKQKELAIIELKKQLKESKTFVSVKKEKATNGPV